MPTGRFSKEDLYTPSGRGFVETVGSPRSGEITEVAVRYHQWQPNKQTGAQVAPLTALFLTIQPLSKDGNHDGNPIEQELVVEFGPKDDSMIKVRPGNMADADTEAVDLAENGVLSLGTEGNAIYVEEGVKLSAGQSFGAFISSLQDQGFKPTVLHTGYLPALIGLRAVFDLTPGREYKNRAGQQVKTENFVVTSISRYPYEKADAPAQTTKTKAKQMAANGADKPKVNGAPKPNGTYTPEVEAAGLELLKTVSKNFSGQELSYAKLFVNAMAIAGKTTPAIPKAHLLSLQALLRDTGWLESHVVDFGAVPAEAPQTLLLVG